KYFFLAISASFLYPEDVFSSPESRKHAERRRTAPANRATVSDLERPPREVMEESSSAGGADRGGGDAGDPLRNASQGKSCKGCLYYSSLLKADSRNPLCLGLTRPLKHGSIPSSSPLFLHYLDLLVDRKTSAAEHVPTHVHNKEGNIMPQVKSNLCNFAVPVHAHREEAKTVHAPRNNFFSKCVLTLIMLSNITSLSNEKTISMESYFDAGFPGVRGLWPQV
ncbi:hypothetical protein GW17_00027007, partial [Ensete ventricosum]